ncbi:GNAT family N-acetyltransferase [Streptomyces sp. NPDC058653]|uniref:GNAT family N-acetyltransferase n=1 Tax=Streptomyces sp. NPDC058653 TaxID=3346576 RepID=UPI00365E18A4
MEKPLKGALVVLRPAVPDDIPALAAIRATPEVHATWRGGDDLILAVTEDLDEPDVTSLVIELDGATVGAVQFGSEEDADYRHANVDIYLDPAVHGRGVGTDAVRTLVRHLIDDLGHHRVVIDPAADNTAAIRCYGKVGFRPVGIMREYERGADGTWHDGLLMDLLAGDLTTGPISDLTDGADTIGITG